MNMRISLSCLLCLTWLIACAPTLSEQPTVRPAPTPSPTATTLALVTSVSTAANPAPTPAPINSARWPTFRSDGLGFSLNYPPDWEITDQQQSVYLLTNENFGSGPEPMNYYVYVGEYANPQGRPFVDVATAGLSEELKRAFTFTPRMIGNYQAYEATRIPSQLGALTIFLEGDKRYLAVALTPYYDAQSPWPAQDKYMRLFRALLETIRLTR